MDNAVLTERGRLKRSLHLERDRSATRQGQVLADGNSLIGEHLRRSGSAAKARDRRGNVALEPCITWAISTCHHHFEWKMTVIIRYTGIIPRSLQQVGGL